MHIHVCENAKKGILYFFVLCAQFFLSYLIGHGNVFDVLVMSIAMLCHAWPSFAF